MSNPEIKIKKFSRGNTILEEQQKNAPIKPILKRGRPSKIQKEEQPTKEPTKQPEPEEDKNINMSIYEDDDEDETTPEPDNIFNDLANKMNYTPKPEPEPELEPEPETEMTYEPSPYEVEQFITKFKSKKPTSTKPTSKTQDNDNDFVFSDTPTEVLGRSKRELISKLTQYKSLFPTELKTFKV